MSALAPFKQEERKSLLAAICNFCGGPLGIGCAVTFIKLLDSYIQLVYYLLPKDVCWGWMVCVLKSIDRWPDNRVGKGTCSW